MPSIQFAVSPNGNGIGVINLVVGSGNSKQLLQIEILPKFWGVGQKTLSSLDLDVESNSNLDSEDPIQVTVFEGSSLRITSKDSELIESLRKALGLCEFKDEREETSTNVRLLVEEIISDAKVAEPSLTVASNLGVWPLLNSLQETAESSVLEMVKIPDFSDNNQLDALRGATNFGINPLVEKLIAKLFLHKMLTLIARIRPEFQTVDNSSKLFRGKLKVNSLADWLARRRDYLVFSQTELKSDTELNRLLRASVRYSQSLLESEEKWALVCQQIDRSFSGATVISSSEAIKLAASVRISRKNRLFREPVAIARLLYSEDSSAFGENSTSVISRAIATGLFLSSARLWEVLLENQELPGGFRLISFKKPLPLRKSDYDTSAAKRPDLAIQDATGKIVATVDAKYKSLDSATLQSMPNEDQYQQYAYASTSNLPSLFVYCGESASSPAVDEIMQGHDCMGPKPRVGVVSVPFPKDANLRDWWLTCVPGFKVAIEAMGL